jgi:cytochrome c biogenesis protein CcmG/thiol:disulfide interchange protein DsbE
MSNRFKTLVGILAFVVFIGGSYIAYNRLSASYKPESGLDTGKLNQSAQTWERKEGTDTVPGKSDGSGTEPGIVSDGQGQEEKQEKVKAPDFTVADGTGKSVKLSQIIGEKPIVLNFWASWCGPCKSEMPHFDKVYADVKDDVTFMMVDLVDGQRETTSTGKKYIEAQGYKFPVYFDTEQQAALAYGIQAIPTTFFIDTDGYIVAGKQGGMDEETLRKYIEVLKQQK